MTKIMDWGVLGKYIALTARFNVLIETATAVYIYSFGDDN